MAGTMEEMLMDSDGDDDDDSSSGDSLEEVAAGTVPTSTAAPLINPPVPAPTTAAAAPTPSASAVPPPVAPVAVSVPSVVAAPPVVASAAPVSSSVGPVGVVSAPVVRQPQQQQQQTTTRPVSVGPSSVVKQRNLPNPTPQGGSSHSNLPTTSSTATTTTTSSIPNSTRVNNTVGSSSLTTPLAPNTSRPSDDTPTPTPQNNRDRLRMIYHTSTTAKPPTPAAQPPPSAAPLAVGSSLPLTNPSTNPSTNPTPSYNPRQPPSHNHPMHSTNVSRSSLPPTSYTPKPIQTPQPSHNTVPPAPAPPPPPSNPAYNLAFEPTPIQEIKDKIVRANNMRPTRRTNIIAGGNGPGSGRPGSPRGGSRVDGGNPSGNIFVSAGGGGGQGGGGGGGGTVSAMAYSQDQKDRKKSFLNFTRVLMKYLENRDKIMHGKAKTVIRECAEENRKNNPKFASLSVSMQVRLKELVGDLYWKKTEDYLCQFLKKDYEKKDRMNPRDALLKAKEMAKIAASPLPEYNTTIASMHEPDMRQHQQEKLLQQQKEERQRQHHQQQQLLMQQQQQRQEQKKKAEDEKNKRAAAAAAAAAAPSYVKTNSHHIALAKMTPNVTPGMHKQRTQNQKNKKLPAGAAHSPILNGSAGVPANMNLSDATLAVPPLTTTSLAPAKLQPYQHQPPPKEYADLMELVDHATNYDAKSCVLLLGPKHQIDDTLNLSEEQNKLLHSGGLLGSSSNSTAEPPPPSSSHWTPSLPPYRKGWGQRNIVSARVAWAKLRLMEQKESAIPKLALPGSTTTTDNQTATPPKTLSSSTTNETTKDPSATNDFGKNTTEWFNEEKAEHDEALALISEGTQLYIRRILEGAISAARHRLNLDGVRLWHQQHAAVAAANNESSASARMGTNPTAANNVATGNNGSAIQTSHKEVPQPPLLLRLGCDVSRQYALTQGNAAKVCQRMEEALARSGNASNDCGDGSSNLADAETLYQATSMADLSRLPKLKSASSNADYHAKRRFEVYGGKDSGLPPFGRLPKKVKITPRDVQFCLLKDSSLTRFQSKRRVARVFM